MYMYMYVYRSLPPSSATPTTVSCLKHNPSSLIHCETNLKFAARQPNYTNDIRSARQTKGSFRLCMCVCGSVCVYVRV